MPFSHHASTMLAISQYLVFYIYVCHGAIYILLVFHIHRGYIFGTWTCHQYVGNIVAAVLTTVILNSGGLNWTLALVIPALGMIGCFSVTMDLSD